MLPAMFKTVKLPRLVSPGALVIVEPRVEPLKTVLAPIRYVVAVIFAWVTFEVVAKAWFSPERYPHCVFEIVFASILRSCETSPVVSEARFVELGVVSVPDRVIPPPAVISPLKLPRTEKTFDHLREVRPRDTALVELGSKDAEERSRVVPEVLGAS
jgi:hypothetical protein